MAFNSKLFVLTQPGATGNQTYSLPANFDPKAIIIWGTPQAADGSVASWAYGMGVATYRNSLVLQRCAVMRGLDAANAADNAISVDSTSVFRILTQGAGLTTIDCEIDLVSMQGGATSEVVLNWVNLHTTASIRLFMLVLGGSDLTDALALSFSCGTAATTVDKTVLVGFGQPDAVLLFSSWVGFNTAGTSPQLSIGFGKKGEDGRCFAFTQTDGNTASIVASSQRSDRIVRKLALAGASDEVIGKLDAPANWPTDGFRLLFDAIPSANHDLMGLALKGNFQMATGNGVAPIAGGLPVVQDLAAGFPPKVGFVMGWNLAAATAIDTASADAVGFGIGATDGTQEAWAGFTEDDAATTMDSNQQQSTAKVIRNYSPAAALQSEADGSFSGNNFRLSWNDIDTVARQYQWFAIGDAGAQLYTDADTVTLALTPSANETAQLVDSATVPLALTVSGTEQKEILDSDTVSLKLTPSSTDIGALVDTNTVSLKLTPSVVEKHIPPPYIEHVGSVGAAGNSVSLAGIPWKPGDRLLIFAFRDGTTGPPSLPAGLGYSQILGSNGTLCACVVAERTLDSTATTTGAFTNATEIVAMVYRNIQSISTFANGSMNRQDTDNVMIWGDPQWTESDFGTQDGRAWVLAFGGHRTATNVEQAISGLINRVSAGTEVAGFDSNGPVGWNTYHGGSITVNASSGWITITLRLFSSLREVTEVYLSLTPSSAEEYAQAVYFRLTPSATEEYVPLANEDAVTIPLALTPSSVENVQLADSGTARLNLTPSSTDVLAAVDSATALLALAPSAVETKEISDAATAQLQLTPSSSDIAAYVDSNAASIALSPSGVETREISDSGTIRLSITPSSTDLAVLVDSSTVSLSFTITALEERQKYDQATVGLLLLPSSVDVAGFVDSNTISLLLSPSTLEEKQQYDATTITLALTPSSIDTAQFVEAATARLTLTPFADEQISGTTTDAATVRLSFLPSAIEVPVYADAATALVKLTPSVVSEGVEHADSNTSEIRFTPGAIETTQYVEAITARLTFTPSATFAGGNTDFAVASLQLSASGTEFAEFADLATATLGLQPSGITVSTLVDSNEVALRLQPAAIEAPVYVDAGTVVLTLTPLAVPSIRHVFTSSCYPRWASRALGFHYRSRAYKKLEVRSE